MSTPTNAPARGIIRNRQFAAQLRLFEGLRWGNITPTDVDGLIDFGGEAFVFIETKHEGASLPLGQRLALEHLTDLINGTGTPCVTLVATHVSDADIMVADCPVAEYRFRGQWNIPPHPMTVREAIDGFRKKHVEES